MAKERVKVKDKLFDLYREHDLMSGTADKQLTEFIDTLSNSSIKELINAISE